MSPGQAVADAPRAEPFLSETWWVAADAHVGGNAARLDAAVDDMNRLDLKLDYAIQLGDNVSDRHEGRAPFLEAMGRLNVARWDYILGNHDFGPDHEPVFAPRYFARTVNGIRMIFLSDELDGRINRKLVMSEAQREWFLQELEAHKGCPVILFTHQPHSDVEGFAELDLGRYDIRAWFHGHRHRWMIEGKTRHGFLQIGINAISGTFEDGGGQHSSVLHIREAEHGTEFTLRFRRHDTGEWIRVGGQDAYRFMVETPPICRETPAH